MADTVKGLPEVKINHFGMTGIKDAFVDGLECKGLFTLMKSIHLS